MDSNQTSQLQTDQSQQLLEKFAQLNSSAPIMSYGRLTPEEQLKRYNLTVPRKMHRMVIRIDKGCWYCEYAATCPVTAPSYIAPICEVSQLKAAAVEAGLLYVQVIRRQEGIYIPVYKNKILIGEIVDQPENQELIRALGMYSGHGIFLYTKLHKELSHSVYTVLTAGVAGYTKKKV